MELKELISTSSLDRLNQIKQEEEERYQKETERLVKESFERKRPYRFTSRQELIDYVKAGNKLYEEDDNGHICYIPELKMVVHYSMQYDKECDMPLGMGNTYMTWEQFEKWTSWMDNKEILKLNHDTIPYWRKSYE